MRFLIIASIFLIIIFYSNMNEANAQTIENVVFKISDNKAYITYDLVDANENQQLYVKVFNNLHGYDKPLSGVTGDVGKEVTPGMGKTIVYLLNEELKSYNFENINFIVTVTAKQFYRAVKR